MEALRTSSPRSFVRPAVSRICRIQLHHLHEERSERRRGVEPTCVCLERVLRALDGIYSASLAILLNPISAPRSNSGSILTCPLIP